MKEMKDLKAGLDQQEKEISNHYLDHMRYGLAGSDGSCLSNYIKYHQNNHELLGICYADPRNPYNKRNRFLSFFSKVSLSFLLFAIFSEINYPYYLEVIIVVAILSPYGYFIDAISTCSFFYRHNFLVKTFHSLGCFILFLIFILNIFNLILGIVLLFYYKPTSIAILGQFLLSILFDQLKPLYFDIFN